MTKKKEENKKTIDKHLLEKGVSKIDDFHKFFIRGKYCISKQFLKEKLEEFEKELKIKQVDIVDRIQTLPSGRHYIKESDNLHGVLAGYIEFMDRWQKFKQSLIGKEGEN